MHGQQLNLKYVLVIKNLIITQLYKISKVFNVAWLCLQIDEKKKLTDMLWKVKVQNMRSYQNIIISDYYSYTLLPIKLLAKQLQF